MNRPSPGEVERLRRQVERERHARREAELISERATLELQEKQAALAEQTQELETIVAMSRELAQAGDSDEVGDVMARYIARAVGIDECGICRWDRANNAVVTYGYHPPEGRNLLDDVYSLAEYPETRRVLVERRSSIIDSSDPLADPAEVRFLTSRGGSQLVMLPMVVKGQAVGVIELLSRSGASLDQGRLGLAQMLADEAGFVLENARLQEQLRHETLHDPLTGLPNRTLFGDRLAHALKRGRGPDHPPVALLFLDVDHFKVINDSFGHEVGDRVLRAVAERLERLVRPGDTVARLGDDEFGLVLEDIRDPGAGPVAASRIAEVFRTPVQIGGQQIPLSFSIGIDVGTAATNSPDDLVRNAEFAMFGAKQAGRARHRIYAPAEREAANERTHLVADLRNAVARGELRILYQPIVDLRSHVISAFEALVRWQHPERGLLLPAAFVPVAEESGAIVEVGSWVLERACEELRVWQRERPDLAVAVNLSARQLQSPGLVDQVRGDLQQTGIAPSSLVLEVTETVLLADARTATVLGWLKALGVRIAIDDFGTGYSSISHLRQFPVDILKIDRQFVQNTESPEGAALLRGIIGLGRSVGLDLIAEGIEREDQAAFMVAAACDQGQGFLFAHPMPPEDVAHLLGSAMSFG